MMFKIFQGILLACVSLQVSTWNSGYIFCEFLRVFSPKLVEITQKKRVMSGLVEVYQYSED